MKTSKNGRRVIEPMEKLSDDIATIRADLTALVGGKIGAMGERTKEALGLAGENARELAGAAREQAGAMHQRLSDVAASRPLTTIMVAAAAGAIAAKIMSCRHRD